MNLQTIKPIAFAAAMIISLLLLLAYLSGMSGFKSPIHLPYGLAFALIFPVWAYTIFYLKTKHPQTAMSNLSLAEKINTLLDRPGTIGLIVAALLYANAFYCMYLLFTGDIIDPTLGEDGRYFFNNHGKMTYYSEAEALEMHRKNSVAYSGLFLLFSGLASIILWPKKENTIESE